MTNLQGVSSKTSASPRAGLREWIGLAVLMLPTILIAMDLTVLHLAIPSISEDLQPTSTQLLWITDIYGFMIAGSLITMGTLGDRIGRRRLLMIGAAAFGATSILAASSTSAGMLIFSRALLGIAGATLMPSTMSLIRNMFPDSRQRTAAIGVWVSGFSAGSAIGPLVGGFLLEHFSWGSVFLIAVPIMVLLVVGGLLVLPEYKDPKPGRFDLIGAVMSIVAVLSIIFGVKQLAEIGLDFLALGAITLGLIVGYLFIRRQRLLPDPLIDLKLFRVPAFSASLMTYGVGIFVAFGVGLFTAQYLQLVLGLSPMEAGIWSLPGAVISIIASNTAPRLARRIRTAYIVAAGLISAAVGLAIIAQAGIDSLGLVVGGNLLISLGFGFAFTLTIDMVVATAPPERAGAASAIAETAAELGGALGIAVLGTIGMLIYSHQLAATMPPGISAEAAVAAEATLGGAVIVAAGLPADAGATLMNSASYAFVHGLQLVAFVGMIAFAGLTALTLTILRHIRPETAHEDELEMGYETVASISPHPELIVGD